MPAHVRLCPAGQSWTFNCPAGEVITNFDAEGDVNCGLRALTFYCGPNANTGKPFVPPAQSVSCSACAMSSL